MAFVKMRLPILLIFLALAYCARLILPKRLAIIFWLWLDGYDVISSLTDKQSGNTPFAPASRTLSTFHLRQKLIAFANEAYAIIWPKTFYFGKYDEL